MWTIKNKLKIRTSNNIFENITINSNIVISKFIIPLTSWNKIITSLEYKKKSYNISKNIYIIKKINTIYTSSIKKYN